MTSQLIPFLALVLLITLTPGPDTLLVVRNTIARGWRFGLLTAFGSCTGLMIWGAASALGVATLFTVSVILSAILRFVGAAYLFYLGSTMLWKAMHKQGMQEEIRGLPVSLNSGTAFRQGLLTDLLNPKAVAFFTALLPQFVSRGDSVFATTLIYATIASIAALSGFSLYAFIAATASTFLRRQSTQRSLDSVTGSVLVAIGARLALHRSGSIGLSR